MNKEENQSLIDSLLALISKVEQKEVYQIIASELLNYAPLSDTQNRIDKNLGMVGIDTKRVGSRHPVSIAL